MSLEPWRDPERLRLRELAERLRAGAAPYWSDAGSQILDALDDLAAREEVFARPDIEPILWLVDPHDALPDSDCLELVKETLEVVRDALDRAGLKPLADSEGMATVLRAFLS